MNKLILIGNGFDLAHGLKTSYKDFVMWYLSDIVQEYKNSKKYDDQLFCALEVSHLSSISPFELEDISEVEDFFKRNNIKTAFKSRLFEVIHKRSSLDRWVDIEYLYFELLKGIVKSIHDEDEVSMSQALSDVEKLNSDLSFITSKLKHYLLSLKHIGGFMNDSIADKFRNILVNKSSWQHRVLCLNFNYTSLIYNYAPVLNINAAGTGTSVINIHGSIDKIENPMIFGYGDEIDPVYLYLENLPDNKFRDQIKSFWYLKTDNYRRLRLFCDDNPFRVFIMGHSCGLSDRVLLNFIFEHKNCESIQIFYFQRPDGSNDFFEKTQEISRHFKAENKVIMRERIIPFDNCMPLT